MGNTAQPVQDFSDFSHDLKSPLYIAKSLIRSHLEYLESNTVEQIDAKVRKTHGVLKQSAKQIERVLSLLRRLNQLAKNDAQSVPLKPQGVALSLKTVLNRVLMGLREDHCLDHLVLVQAMPDDLPEASVDEIDLEEIIYNLITNASQATIPGGVLRISGYLEWEPEFSVAISFEDTGHGITHDALPHIFDPFYTDHAEDGGVGFGLYIVKQLVERNKGWIEVESQSGTGTRFTLFFPLPTQLAA